MGAGRRTEAVVLQNNPQHQPTCNSNPPSARNLRRKDLGGVIFGCTHYTFKECIFKQMFGLPAPHFQYVQNITQGMPLFLFNYSDRTLHGIFEAISAGQMYINRYAWTLDGQEITPYPAQVRVNIRQQCQPLTEKQYKPILADNYLKHEPNHIMFELDRAQTQRLISLFSASPLSPSVSLPSTAVKWGTLFGQSAGAIASQEDCTSGVTNVDMQSGFSCNSTDIPNDKSKMEVSLDQHAAENQENGTAFAQGKVWSSLFKTEGGPVSKKEYQDSNSEELSTMSEDEPPILSEMTGFNAAPCVIPEMTCKAEAPLPVVSKATCSPGQVSSEVLQAVVNKLMLAMGEIKELQIMQTQKIQSLESELEEANNKLRELELRRLNSEHHTILLVGGFDGTSWLQNLDTYNAFDDVISPVAQMKPVRSYASAVELNRYLYLLGGGYGSSWYDTVESCNLDSGEWLSCPSLNRKKGNLAGASLLGKIFAIGGGNATDCFSEVEVLDLNVGKWITTRSMANKRFAPAVAEFNGVLYVTGGYDGQNYLRSVERLDPRANSWMEIKGMKSRRGCHSLTALKEKLYAVGGYDGTRMVPTVEVFEPRTGSWIMSEPMKFARGYLGAVTLRDKIYAIGGMQEDDEILDTVECYSEGEGWKLTQLESVGKRCFFSAVAV